MCQCDEQVGRLNNTGGSNCDLGFMVLFVPQEVECCDLSLLFRMAGPLC